ncbi:S-adenosyl-L-methionine-dependent methyltransferase [Limtongia smithiae]|uniref:S-adenosyl-L-methionine-dependent methyltransferase n=1 Tax=Limtongia smithiae TaxID=1125753 RepID=UPI0034CDC836
MILATAVVLSQVHTLAFVLHFTAAALAPAYGIAYITAYRPFIINGAIILCVVAALSHPRRHRRARRFARHFTATVYASIVPAVVVRTLAGSHTLAKTLGPWFGALVVDLVATLPVIAAIAGIVAREFAGPVGTAPPSWAKRIIVAVAATRLCALFQSRVVADVALPILNVLTRQKREVARVAMPAALEQVVIGVLYAATVAAVMSRYRRSLFMFLVVSTAAQGAMVRNLRDEEGYTLVASTMSKTGYVAVVDVTGAAGRDLRVLRNDHTIIGGEYTTPASGVAEKIAQSDENWVREPLAAGFIMQEAIRLVVPEPAGSLRNVSGDSDVRQHALVLGLGTGSAARAMARHGIATDVVEIDAAVLRYAEEYFDFPRKASSARESASSLLRVRVLDAREFTRVAAAFVRSSAGATDNELELYDYVMHDLFAGGMVAPALITKEMWQDVRALLAPDGIVVLNIGGDMYSPLARAAVRTLADVFRDGHCRMYRDTDKMTGARVNHAVVFCRGVLTMVTNFGTEPPRQRRQRIEFRRPRGDDYMGTLARRQSFPLKHEVALSTYLYSGADAAGPVVEEDNERRFAGLGAQGAAGEWAFEGGVLGWSAWSAWR